MYSNLHLILLKCWKIFMLLPSCAQVYVCSFFSLSIRSSHFYKKIVVHFKRLALSFNLLAKGSSILYAFIHLVCLSHCQPILSGYKVYKSATICYSHSDPPPPLEVQWEVECWVRGCGDSARYWVMGEMFGNHSVVEPRLLTGHNQPVAPQTVVSITNNSPPVAAVDRRWWPGCSTANILVTPASFCLPQPPQPTENRRRSSSG